MAEENKVVETKIETATTQPETTVNATEVDYETILAQKDAELAKVREEKDNYRKGLLKVKGKLPEEEELDSSTPEGMEALIDRKVTEKMLSTQEAKLQAEKDATIKALAKRTKELETALRNRGQISSTSAMGSNEDRAEVKTDTYFSNDQVKSLKAKGWSDEKIELARKNMLKGPQTPTTIIK